MKPLRFAVLPLRVILLLAFAGVTVLQTLSFPGGWAFFAQQHPEQAWLRWPLTLFSTAELLCVQVVFAAGQLVAGGIDDDIKGTLLEAGAGHHVGGVIGVGKEPYDLFAVGRGGGAAAGNVIGGSGVGGLLAGRYVYAAGIAVFGRGQGSKVNAG